MVRRNKYEHAIIITADQVAVKDGVIREKPRTDEECYDYLRSYVHSDVSFYSAISVYNTDTKESYTDCDVSTIEFDNIPQEVQDHLVAIGDVKLSCGGITVENPEFQSCIKGMDSYDRVISTNLPHS